MILENFIDFLDTYNLPWLILAILSWIVIYFTCSFNQFLHGLPVALWTMTIGGILEHFFINEKFWQQRYILVQLGELDLFVLIGPFFTIGLLLIRFLPRSPWGKFLLIFMFSMLSTVIELLSVKLGFLEYHPEKWGILYSLVAYYLGLMSALGFYYIFYNKTTLKSS
ncbi:hypothetical protein [Alkaliphilus peptidifermentans]|uniref:ABC-transporter type IV n=1 Tax=Alkaliphilus peptidifermentans DSM 18978 TaxID=1120976 RepID=A0A1G5FZP2_9FIRM|nr:hypothetical protein [Alkaliphilus peptidifermentans]SCY44567.1 hypothetical protein SAMN03080606_01551 [Alkaliphilus peptidifermentans DSM 18978]